ncbi:MAG TPA: MmcQ/YjbR family DNA-binding protein [Puia sp.]|nr:MmcQ/YjbR family DNA-binding protein [Puia sp.]
MNIEEVRAYCLRKPGAAESFPFGEEVLVFKVGGKIFLLANLTEGNSLNVKCDPERAVELRERHEEVQPGYHMNKRHWNTVRIDGVLKTKDIRDMIDHSYEMVVASLPKKVRDMVAKLSLCTIMVLCAFSCSRSGPVTLPPPTQNGSMTVNLTCPRQAPTYQNQFELILSETSGKILLDDLTQVNTVINATLQTADTLINVTSIFYDSVYHKFDCRTYKAVNPTRWATSVNGIVQLDITRTGGQPATILYKNPRSLARQDGISMAAVMVGLLPVSQARTVC